MTISALTFAAVLATASAQGERGLNLRTSVERGLTWLAGQQQDDGSWTGTNGTQPTTSTSFAGLALLMEGSTLQTGEYAENLRKAVAWFEKNAATTGQLGGTHPSETARVLTSHAHALLFLVCAYDADENRQRRARVRAVVERAITYAAATQLANGGWSLTSRPNLREDSQTTIDMLHALLTARRVGFDVPRQVTDKVLEYLTKATNARGAVARPGTPMVAADRTIIPPLTAGAVLALLPDEARRPPAFDRWVTNIPACVAREWPKRATGTTTYTTFQMARLGFALGEKRHRALDPAARADDVVKWSEQREKLVRSVAEAQGADGSWLGSIPGPVYTTSLALILLQLDNNYVPAFSR